MIYAGIIVGVATYYWLMPKWVAARIIRWVEAQNRAANSNRRNEEKGQ